jgi:hypothetical protein
MSMNDAFPTDRRGNWAESAQQWQQAMTFINKATSALSISQMIIPLEDVLDLLLDAALSATQQETRLSEIRRSFTQRWNQVAEYTISGETKRNSQKILMDRTYDLGGGTVSFGRELAEIFWAALADLDNDRPTTEATDLFPVYESVRPFLRVMATRWGETYLPVIAFSPLADEEWAVLLADLNRMIDLALQIEGVLILWLIGSFVTDAFGRRTLRPRISYGPPPQGTRAKQLRCILGTNYYEIKALQASGRVERRRHLRATEEMTAHWSKHRVTIQLAADANDYELFHRAGLANLEAEISHRIVMAEAAPQRDRTAVVQPGVAEEPRLTIGPAVTEAPMPRTIPSERGEVSAETDPRRDAEELRRKGALAKAYDVALAKKYLLASTVLDNSSVDVWLDLADMSDKEEEKAWFRKEAQRLLGRSPGSSET